MVHSCRMKPASARGSFGEVPGNQAWCGGGILESHRRLGGVPCVVASGVSKTTAGSLPPPMSRCPKDPVRAEGSHPCGQQAVRSLGICVEAWERGCDRRVHSRGIVRLGDDPARVGLGRTASCGKHVAPGSWLAGACAGKGLLVKARSGNPAAASGPSGLYAVSVTASSHLHPLNGAGAGEHRRAC